MIYAIICFVVGAGFFITNSFLTPESAVQQTVQGLGFVCSSIFIVGGFILLQLNKLINKDKIKLLNN